MELAEEFLAAVWRISHEPGLDDQLTPTVLTRACCEVLPIAGAGITVHDELLRLPLAASDAISAWVEQLQATLGDGPCVDAMADRLPLVAGPATMIVCWPSYTRQVFARTPFRSVAALPLATPQGPVFGALTLFSATSDLGDLLDVDKVQREIGDLVAGILNGQLAGQPFDGLAGIDWWHTDALTHRRQVWMAVAISSATAHVSQTVALTALRTDALRHRVTLDQWADQLINQHLGSP